MSTKIEWCDEVYNPVTGCSHSGMPGCDSCYAKRFASRLKGKFGYPKNEPFKVTLHPDRLEQPLHWKKPRRVFTCSMGDLFHPDVPFDFIQQVWGAMLESPHHKFLVLTKRPERMKDFLDRWLAGGIAMKSGRYTSHIWLGVSCSTQEDLDKLIIPFLHVKAAVKFISFEPLLGPISRDISKEYFDWVIVGGESGPKARPMHPEWVKSIRDQCVAAGVSFFFKSWGEWAPDCFCGFNATCKTIPRPEPGKLGCMFRCGKKKAGRELDGRVWEEFPE